MTIFLAASVGSVLGDIAGILILAVLALLVYGVISLLFLPKTVNRSRRIEEEERRRDARAAERNRVA